MLSLQLKGLSVEQTQHFQMSAFDKRNYQQNKCVQNSLKKIELSKKKFSLKSQLNFIANLTNDFFSKHKNGQKRIKKIAKPILNNFI